jgi:predicted nucleotidyltransferase
VDRRRCLWERLAPGAVSAQIDDLRVQVIGYEDLVALKQQAGRPEDLADLRRLSQARGEDRGAESPERDSNS